MTSSKRKRYRLEPSSFDITKVTKALHGTDPLGQIVRMHLYIEATLAALIESALAYPDALDIGQLSFPMKVELTVALDRLPPQQTPALMALNSIRNAVAHHPEASMTEEQGRALINALDPVQKLIATETLKRLPRPTGDTTALLTGIFTLLLEQVTQWQGFATKPSPWREKYGRTIDECAVRLEQYH